MNVKKVLLLPILTVVAAFTAMISVSAAEPVVTYSAHVQRVGWMNDIVASNSTATAKIAGTSGQSLRVEALKINVANAEGVDIKYRAHVQRVGWQDWVSAGEIAGTNGQHLRVEGIEIYADGLKELGYALKYRAHVQRLGWTDWIYAADTMSSDEPTVFAGSSGLSLRVEAIEIVVEKVDAAKTEAIAELKELINRNELSERTIKANGRNKDQTDIAAAVTAAKEDGIEALKNADTVEEVVNIVTDYKNQINDAMRSYFLTELSAYDDEALVTDASDDKKYSLDDDNYDKYYELIEKASDMSIMVSSYKAAMAARFNVTTAQKAAVKELKSFITASGLDAKDVDIILSETTVKRASTKYSEAAVIKAVIDNAYVENETTEELTSGTIYNAYTAEKISEAVEKAKEALVKAVQSVKSGEEGYLIGQLAALYNDGNGYTSNGNKYYVDKDVYNTVRDAVADAASIKDAIAAYETVFAKRESADEKDLADLKEKVMDAFNDNANKNIGSFDYNFAVYDPDMYSMESSKVSTIRNTFKKDVEAAKITSVVALAEATAKVQAAYTKFKESMDKLTNDTTTKSDLKAEIAKALGDTGLGVNAIGIKTIEDTLKATLLPLDASSNYMDVESIANAIENAKSSVEAATTVEDVKTKLEAANKDINAKVVAYAKSQVTSLYNSGRKVKVKVTTKPSSDFVTDEKELIFTKDAYTEAVNGLALNGNTYADATALLNTFVGTKKEYSVLVGDRMTALWTETGLSDGQKLAVAKEIGYSTYAKYMESVLDKAEATSTLDAINTSINNSRVNFVSKVKAYLTNEISDAVSAGVLSTKPSETDKYALYQLAKADKDILKATSSNLATDWANLESVVDAVDSIKVGTAAYIVNYDVQNGTPAADLTGKFGKEVVTSTTVTPATVSGYTVKYYATAADRTAGTPELTTISGNTTIYVKLTKNA